MSEQNIQRKAKKGLEAVGCYVTKVNPGIYGASIGHSDLFISVPPERYLLHGEPGKVPLAVYAEAKAKTKKPSMMQVLWHTEMRKNGHWTFVFRSSEDVFAFLASKGVTFPSTF